MSFVKSIDIMGTNLSLSFVILSREEIESLANNVLATFKDPFMLDDQEYFITASVGISISTYGHNNDLESVLHQAEQAVYYAKQNGRFHYQIL